MPGTRSWAGGAVRRRCGTLTGMADVKEAREALSDVELELLDRYWRAANYLSVGQIYLLDNPLLREALRPEHVKPRLLGHFGTTPGLNLLYAHLNRLIRERDSNVIFVTGPGHGGPGLVANTYLEGTYSELYPVISRDEGGLRRLFRQFSFPGGIPSHVAPETPGSIHEGGELGYALSHAFGAAFDNPDLLVACVVGDGEAETGPLATELALEQVPEPGHRRRRPADPAPERLQDRQPDVLARIPRGRARSAAPRLRVRGRLRRGRRPEQVHRVMAAALDAAVDEIDGSSERRARATGPTRPRWPMIVLRTPKGWTGPKEVDGVQVEGTWRSHQVPVTEVRENPDHLHVLEEWMRSYRPEELFDESGALRAELAALAPEGERRMGANPHANGGLLLRDLRLPDFRDYAVKVASPGPASSRGDAGARAFLLGT